MFDVNKMSSAELNQLFADASAQLNAMSPAVWQNFQATYPNLYNSVMVASGAHANGPGVFGAPQANYPVTTPDNHHKEGVPLWTIAFMYRRIQIHAPIMPESVRMYRMQTRYLTSAVQAKDSRKVTGLHYYFDTPGGAVSYGLQLFDDMLMAQRFNNEPVFTHIEGMGASMGSLLPQAASFGCRFMEAGLHSHSQMMIHNLLWEAGRAKQADHERNLGQSRDYSSILYNIYLKRIIAFRRNMLGQTVNPEDEADILYHLLRSMEEQDSFMCPAQTMEFGLTDFTRIDDESYEAYMNALLWYHGFRHENVVDRGVQKVVGNENRTYKSLDDDERTRALEEVRRLQKENFAQTKDLIAGQVDPAVQRVKDKLSSLQNKEKRGPYRSDITLEACKEYVLSQQESNNDGDED